MIGDKLLNFSIDFHEKTKHSPESVYKSTWSLDWANKPYPFKVYTGLNPIPLPEEYNLPEKNTLEAISRVTSKSETITFSKKLLASFLFFTGGISRVFKHPEQSFYMRTASATGALYPIELYAITQEFSDLEDGIYHFSVGDFTLNQIRKGNYFEQLSSNCSDIEIKRKSPLTLIFSSYATRNSWKYRERSYRHWFWDGGVMIANTIAVASAFNLQAKIITAFNDRYLNNLCGLTEKQEAIIAIVSIFQKDSIEINNKQNMINNNIHKLYLDSLKIANKEYDFELIWDIHEKTSIQRFEDIQSWNNKVNSFDRYRKIKKTSDFDELLSERDILSLEKTILQRGSTNRFKHEQMSEESFLLILKSANSGFASDFFPNYKSTFINCYVSVHDVENIEPGSYYFDLDSNSLKQLKNGNFRTITSQLCLGQRLFGSTNAVIFLLADIESMVNHFGDRAYRVAQLEGGILSGKIYLSCYALKLGARGTTFFDDEVTRFFSPHADNKSVMMAVGIGIPDYKAKSGKKLKPIYTRKEMINELINYLAD